MSDQKITIHELPTFWQEKVRSLRAENAKLRRERNFYRDLLMELHPSALEGSNGNRAVT